jgi:hypothetical protein
MADACGHARVRDGSGVVSRSCTVGAYRSSGSRHGAQHIDGTSNYVCACRFSSQGDASSRADPPRRRDRSREPWRRMARMHAARGRSACRGRRDRRPICLCRRHVAGASERRTAPGDLSRGARRRFGENEFGAELQNHRPHRRTFTTAGSATAARWLGPNDVERDKGFEPSTSSLGTLLTPLPPPTLPSHSSHLSVSGRPKASRVVALEVGFEVGSFSAFARSPQHRTSIPDGPPAPNRCIRARSAIEMDAQRATRRLGDASRFRPADFRPLTGREIARRNVGPRFPDGGCTTCVGAAQRLCSRRGGR